jgi:uncharacterized protein YaaR (DUF327 family)
MTIPYPKNEKPTAENLKKYGDAIRGKKKQDIAYEIRKMLQAWLDNDFVKSGVNYNIIEKENDCFARGWRWAIYSVIRKIEEEFEK